MLGLDSSRYATINTKQPSYADQFIADSVPSNMLFVDYSYARPLTQARMRKLDKQKYDHRKVGVVLVSMRNTDGTFALIDGQGRLYLARRDEIATMPARVYLDLTVEQEAELYLAFNRDRDETTAVDDYIARLVAKEPKALSIKDVLGSVGLHVMRGVGKGNTVQAITAIEGVYSNWGGDALRYVLRKLMEVWPDDSRALTAEMIMGMAAFMARIPTLEKQSGRTLNQKQLTERLQAKTPAQMKALATAQKAVKPGMNIGQAMGRAMHMLYDAGRAEQYRLGDWPEREYTDAGRLAQLERARTSGVTRRERKGTKQA